MNGSQGLNKFKINPTHHSSCVDSIWYCRIWLGPNSLSWSRLCSCQKWVKSDLSSHICRCQSQGGCSVWDPVQMEVATITIHTLLSEAVIELYQLTFTFQDAHQQPRVSCMACFSYRRRLLGPKRLRSGSRSNHNQLIINETRIQAWWCYALKTRELLRSVKLSWVEHPESAKYFCFCRIGSTFTWGVQYQKTRHPRYNSMTFK